MLSSSLQYRALTGGLQAALVVLRGKSEEEAGLLIGKITEIIGEIAEISEEIRQERAGGLHG